MQLIDKLILEQKKELGQVNYIEDYELIFWKKSVPISKNNESLLEKVVRRDKLSYPEERQIKKIIGANKIPTLTFNEFSIRCFNKYNRDEELKPHELNHLQKYVNAGKLVLTDDKLIKTAEWERRELLLNREKDNRKGLLSDELTQINEQLENFYYLEESQIIRTIYQGDTELFLSDQKALTQMRTVDKAEVIRGKVKINKSSRLYEDIKDSKVIKVERLNQNYVVAVFEYDDQSISNLKDTDQNLIRILTNNANSKGFMEKINVYKKKNKKKINVTEFNHDRYIYDAYCHARQLIENAGGQIKQILNEKQQKQEIYSGRLDVEKLRHPDLLVFYDDRLGNEQQLNLEVAIKYKPVYITEKANHFKQMSWYCIDRTQYKTIQGNVPSGHDVYLLPRRW